MNISILGLSALLSALVFASSSSAGQFDPMIDMFATQFKNSGQLSNVATCIGKPEEKVLTGLRGAMAHCLEQHGFQNESLMNSCMKEQSAQRLNVDKTKLELCGKETEERFAQEEAISPSMNKAEIQAIVEAQRQDIVKQAAALAAASKAAGKGTKHLITLPVYGNAEITAHYPDGFSLTPGTTGLPVAMLNSKDSVASIVAFYKKKLPTFESKTFDGDLHVFMQKIPEGFDPLSDLPLLQKTPHVSIFRLPTSNQANKSGTTIEIAYEHK